MGNPSLAGSVGEKRDEVDEALEKIARRKAQQIKMLELDRYLLEQKKELEKLKGEEGKPENKEGEKSEITPEVAMALAKLPEEQRNLVIQTYTMLKGAEKGDKTALAYVLPLMIGYARANPQAQQPDLVKFAEVMVNQIKTGMELAKASQSSPQQSSFDPIALVKTFAEVIRDNVQKPLEEVVQRIQPQPSALEQILLDDKLFERAKALGMFGGGQQQTPSPDVLLEIEKLRTEREMKLEELRQQHQKWLAEQQLEQRKWEQIGQIFQGPVGNILQTIGSASAERIRGKTPAKPIPNVKVEQIQCPKCGKAFYANTLADIAVCPHCGVVLSKAQSGVEKPSEQVQQQSESEPEQQQQ